MERGGGEEVGGGGRIGRENVRKRKRRGVGGRRERERVTVE